MQTGLVETTSFSRGKTIETGPIALMQDNIVGVGVFVGSEVFAIGKSSVVFCLSPVMTIWMGTAVVAGDCFCILFFCWLRLFRLRIITVSITGTDKTAVINSTWFFLSGNFFAH